MSQNAVLKLVVDSLSTCGIPYMVTGSVAGNYYGEPRSTCDIDIVIDPGEASLLDFVRGLPDSFYADTGAARQALAARRMFNIIHTATGLKIDLIVRKDSVFDRTAFSRKRPGEAEGVPCEMIAPEDLALQKLLWARLSDSERQQRDAFGILATQQPHLDMGYLRTWASEIGVENMLEEMLAELPPLNAS